MKSLLIAMLLCVGLLPAAAHAQNEVEADEVYRRGDSVEYVDGWHGEPNLRSEIVGRHADSEKFFISVLYSEKSELDDLVHAWKRSPELLGFAKPGNAKESWAHLRFYDLGDRSQRWRFAGIRVKATPTIVIQPCKSGSWGDPSTVILQREYRGDPKELYRDMAYFLQLYATKLKERPRGRLPRGRGSDLVGDPAAAQYNDLSHRGEERQEHAPWLDRRDASPVQIPPLPHDQRSQYDELEPGYDDNGQCPGPGPCPRPRPRPEPDQDEDDYDGPSPWDDEQRPFKPFRPDANPFDKIKPSSNPFSIPNGLVQFFLGMMCLGSLGVVVLIVVVCRLKANHAYQPMPSLLGQIQQDFAPSHSSPNPYHPPQHYPTVFQIPAGQPAPQVFYQHSPPAPVAAVPERYLPQPAPQPVVAAPPVTPRPAAPPVQPVAPPAATPPTA